MPNNYHLFKSCYYLYKSEAFDDLEKNFEKKKKKKTLV